MAEQRHIFTASECFANVLESSANAIDQVPKTSELDPGHMSDDDPSYQPDQWANSSDSDCDAMEEISVYFPPKNASTNLQTSRGVDDLSILPHSNSLTVVPEVHVLADNNMEYDDMDDLPLPPPPIVDSCQYDFSDLPLPQPPSPRLLMFVDDSVTVNPAEPDQAQTTPSRKRKRNVNAWKRTKKSKAYNSGQLKKSVGQEVGRNIKPPCSQCKRNCTALFSPTVRKSIFDAFWGMGCKKGRRDFIVSHVHTKLKGRSRGKTQKRKKSLTYHLPGENGSVVQVCKMMFLNTLDVSDNMVLYNLKTAQHDMIEAKRHPPAHNKIKEELLDVVRKHIESFPKVESHYCRSDTKKEYLEASLNLRELYRLYVKQQLERGETPVSEFKYRQVFNEEFNYAFHHPSKDTCDVCTKFNLIEQHTPEEQLEFDAHLRRKQQARDSKEKDKNDKKLVTAAFDLQQVITCPKISVSSAYYLRKLNLYNFTILDLSTLQGTCYTWNERECNRGANDIASCVCMWLRARESEGAKHIVFYSDCCGGQNRNRIMITALLNFLSSSSIDKIEQKFFESGHSKNECDSMHSVIERHYAKSDVFLPSGFHEHMRQAQHKKPYMVNVLDHSDISDFSKLNDQCMTKTAFNGIQKIHHIIYEKTEGGVNVKFAEEIGGEAVQKTFLKRGKTMNTFKDSVVCKAYDRPCGIDDKKKADLRKLAEYLPEDCRHFYNTI